MNKKVETLAELKGEEVRLRNELDSKDHFTMKTVIAYSRVHRKIKELESILLWTIFTLIIFIAGCQTFKGATGDSAWILQKLSDNVQVEKEK